MIDHTLAPGLMALVKRSSSSDGGSDGHYDTPTWALGTVILTTLVFLPVLLYIGYTLKVVFPTLAMVEDPNPPEYEPVALSEEAADGPAAGISPVEHKAITASLRATDRLLRSVGGWRSNFRGIVCGLVIGLATLAVAGIFAAIPFVPGVAGTLLASLALVQLHTAWVHIVISNPSPLPFWKRLPPFGKTFEATCVPVFAYWAASTLSAYIPGLLVAALGLPVYNPDEKNKVPHYEPAMAWKGIVVFVVFLVITVFLVVPANTLLVRVQASLLPPEEDPIIPFDRSFDGTVEPAIVGGKGYVHWKDALRTFPRSSWIRLYVLYLKVHAINWAFFVLWAAVIIPQIVFASRKTVESNQQSHRSLAFWLLWAICMASTLLRGAVMYYWDVIFRL